MAGRAGVRGCGRRLQSAARPASTQLAIFCAWRVRGRPGALADGVAFIVPGLIVILALAALFLAGSPPLWVLGAGAGAGAAVPAVPSRRAPPCSAPAGSGASTPSAGWPCLAAGAAAAAALGVWLVLVLLGCGVLELAAQHAPRRDGKARGTLALPLLTGGAVAGGALLSVAWVAVKVGALSYCAAPPGRAAGWRSSAGRT
jgi:chromate transporter